MPPAGTLTIDVEVERRGKAFRDKVLWDLGGAITPEEYARRTAADLKLPLDMEAGLALAIREAVQQRASSAVSTDVGTAVEVVRSAADAAEWSPEIGAPRPKPPPPPPPEEPEPPPPPKREPLPKLENGELPEGWIAEEHSSAAGCAARNSAQLGAQFGAHSLSAHAHPRQEPLADLRRPRGPEGALVAEVLRIVGAAAPSRPGKDERPGSAAADEKPKRRKPAARRKSAGGSERKRKKGD